MKKRLILCLTGFFLLNILIAQDFLQHRDVVQITNWKFHKGDIHSAEMAGDINDEDWQDVNVSHTWKAEDVFTKGPNYYQGVGWYRTKVMLDQTTDNSRYFIRFEGVSLVADVFFNGQYIGTHKGGYSAFIFEITDHIINGQINYIAVKVDNSTQLDVAPSATILYPLFGGIIPTTLSIIWIRFFLKNSTIKDLTV